MSDVSILKEQNMNEQEVIDLMKSSQTEQEWNANCDKVKAACGGYPGFWYEKIIVSGLIKEVAARWGGDGEIHVTPL